MFKYFEKRKDLTKIVSTIALLSFVQGIVPLNLVVRYA
jgi:hypothetical protein